MEVVQDWPTTPECKKKPSARLRWVRYGRQAPKLAGEKGTCDSRQGALRGRDRLSSLLMSLQSHGRADKLHPNSESLLVDTAAHFSIHKNLQ
jgi:hypothetical protein